VCQQNHTDELKPSCSLSFSLLTVIMDRKPKTIFQLDSPFTVVQWPQISSQNQEVILELLCSLLSPLGQYRSNHVTPSKGKRSKKRKRQEAKTRDAAPTPTVSIPPPPEISSFLAIGLNTVTRILESSSQKSKPKVGAIEGAGGESLGTEDMSKESDPAKQTPTYIANSLPLDGHFSAIFVYRSSQPTILNEHLPQLVTTASLAYPDLPPTRLVELPKGSDARLCDALSIPRVSFFGILEGAPHSKALVDLVRECVPEVEIPRLQQAKESRYLPVKINTIETFSPVKKKDKA